MGKKIFPSSAFLSCGKESIGSSVFQRLDVVWRDARWIMDCLQCVRSRQWVGAVPLGLVMGGDPPACPDGEEEESLTARLTWPHRIQAQRQAIAGTTWIQPIRANIFVLCFFFFFYSY